MRNAVRAGGRPERAGGPDQQIEPSHPSGGGVGFDIGQQRRHGDDIDTIRAIIMMPVGQSRVPATGVRYGSNHRNNADFCGRSTFRQNH